MASMTVSGTTNGRDGEPPSDANVITTTNGAPVERPVADQRIGNQLRATLLLQDVNLLEIIQHLTHERIPERLVHARGFNACGYFEVTDDISEYTSAAFLSEVGKRTPLTARFSTVAGERGSAETVRDTRGFAFKLRTDEGILDWMFLSTPVFPIRDGAKFPSFTHATKRNPKSGLPDHTMFWDYMNLNQEAIHFLMFLFSDRATPKDFQHAECFSIHSYRFTTPGKFVYVKIHVKPNQGIENYTADEAQTIAGQDPDHHTRSLFDQLENGPPPSWNVYAQIIDPEKAVDYPINIFDATKTLPFEDFPKRKFGRIVLNKNVENFFAESEQSAFSPTNLVPGWALSPDPILQTRCLAYADTQRHRLGTNYFQLPVNMSEKSFNPVVRDGAAAFYNLGSKPNYYPASSETYPPAPQYAQPDEECWVGPVVDWQSEVVDADFDQARKFWQDELGSQTGQQENFINNVANHLRSASSDVRTKTYEMFTRVDPDLGQRIQDATEGMPPSEKEVPKVTKKMQTLNIADLQAMKQSNQNGAQNFDLFANKKWNLQY
ncbi:heme-dependent catalase [Xylariaceae sp. FL0662B]|nr:heme-dependent catalase [Xylariaceae sp. FL0662B]